MLFLEQRVASEESSLKKDLVSELSLTEKFMHVSKSSFENLTYTDCDTSILKNWPNKKENLNISFQNLGMNYNQSTKGF